MAKSVKSQTYGTRTDRVHKFTLLLTKAERAELEKLAEDQGVTASDILRMFVRGKFRASAA